MDRSRKQRPQYPAREGLIISGDPAGRVMERGFAGGRVSRDPADAVAYQAAFVGTATGRYQSPERRPYEGSSSRRQMEDAPRWSPSRRGRHDFSPEQMGGEESKWNSQKELWQRRHQSPHGGVSRGSRSRERLFSPGPRGGGRGHGHVGGRDRVCEKGEDRFPGEFNEPGNRDRPPEHHPFNEFQGDRGGDLEGQRYSIDGSPRRGSGPSRERESLVHSRWDGPRRSRSPRRDRGSPRRGRGSPRRDRGSPRRDCGSATTDRSSPRRDRDNPRRHRGSPRRERRFETVWGRLGLKYKMSPEAPRRAPSLERHRCSRSPINDGKQVGREEPNYYQRRGGEEESNYGRRRPPDRGSPVNLSLPQPNPRCDNYDTPREVQGDPGLSWGPPGSDQSWGGPHGRLPEGPLVDDGRGTPRPKRNYDDHPGSGREWVDPHRPGNVLANPHSEPSWGGGLHENQGWNTPGPRENLLGLEGQHSQDESDNAVSFGPAYSGDEPNEVSDGFPDDPNVEDDGTEVDKTSKDRPDGPTPYNEGNLREWDKPILKGEITATVGKPPKSSTLRSQKKDMRLFDRDKQVAVVLEGPGKQLTKKDGYYIRKCLIKDVEKVISSKNGPELQFLKSGVVANGWFLFTCGNNETVDWLLKWQPPKIGNQTLLVKRRSEVSEFHKIGFWLWNSKLTVPEILEILKGQNGKLETKHWKHLESEQGKRKSFLTFKIDSESFHILNSYKWNLCCGLNTVQVYDLELPLGKGNGSNGPMKKSADPGFRQSIGPGRVFVPETIRQPMPTIASAFTGSFSTGGHSSKK